MDKTKEDYIARKQLSASIDKGGLQIQQPEEIAYGVHINLIQKYNRKIEQGNLTSFVNKGLLQQGERPSL
jgi:hypothetical protein